jgi:XTP/dITP diphosphohydrolase
VELVIVSHNPEKVRELKRLLQEKFPDIHCVSHIESQHVDGATFEMGAQALALKVSKELNKPCLADDSGLILPYFTEEHLRVRREQLQPSGVFLPDTKKVLQDFGSMDESARSAFLECALSFATPEKGVVKTVVCRMEGFIASQARGSSTFDFASVFIKHDYNKTIAELSASVQSAISHRRKAFEKLLPFLKKHK